MRVRFLVSVSGLLLAFAACGGRTLEGGLDGEPTVTVSGGAPSHAGAAAQGARSGKGGTNGAAGSRASGGSVGAGAQPSSGGAVGMGAQPTGGVGMGAAAPSCPGPCEAIECAPGFVLTANPGDCCGHCEPACGTACADLACPSGTHLELPAGQCCPTCVSDQCAVQLGSYQMLRQQMVDKYSTLGCMSDSDCTIYYEKNQCVIGCGIPLPVAAVSLLDPNLQSIRCSPGCMSPPPQCPPNGAPVCRGARCVDSGIVK